MTSLLVVVEIEPLDDRDFTRSIDKVREVIQELIEDGVQLAGGHFVQGDACEHVLAAIEDVG